jgi:hypothetical protein
MTLLAAVRFAAMIAPIPTAPVPNTTSEAPESGFRTFKTVPAPVCILHPKAHTVLRGRCRSILIAELALAIAMLENEDCPKK